jgi:hypothetical protein
MPKGDRAERVIIIAPIGQDAAAIAALLWLPSSSVGSLRNTTRLSSASPYLVRAGVFRGASCRGAGTCFRDGSVKKKKVGNDFPT